MKTVFRERGFGNIYLIVLLSETDTSYIFRLTICIGIMFLKAKNGNNNGATTNIDWSNLDFSAHGEVVRVHDRHRPHSWEATVFDHVCGGSGEGEGLVPLFCGLGDLPASCDSVGVSMGMIVLF